MPGVIPDPPTDPRQRMAQRLQRAEERLAQLERMHPRPAVSGSAGTGAAPDGTTQLGTGGSGTAWFRINGVWRSIGLT